MPGSAAEGKEMVKEFCLKNDIKTVLDVGPGEGTYYFALQGVPLTRLDGVEIWPPYIPRFNLTDKYNEVYIGDIHDFEYPIYYDLVLLGDVIEHMPRSRGEKVIRDATENARWVVVSLPIYGYYQGAGDDGNTWEAHVEQYSDESIREVLNEYEILESFKGGTVGVYIFKG